MGLVNLMVKGTVPLELKYNLSLLAYTERSPKMLSVVSGSSYQDDLSSCVHLFFFSNQVGLVA